MYHLFKKSANRIIQQLLGIKLHRVQHGCQDWFDIQASGCRINTIFDVGANIGQSALKFREAFPKSLIYCFEPVSTTFQQLKTTVSNDNNINCYAIAFGSTPGYCTIYLTPTSLTNSLIPSVAAEYLPINNHNVEIDPNIIHSENIMVQTVDNFVLENHIERIDLLKIDTEGFDLEVLKGASHILSAGRIAFVLAEIGFNPVDKRHILFDDVRSYLMDKGFLLFGIYDQQLEWSGENRMRYANVCFCNEKAFNK
jgi:FkbM family methyltransferase